MSRDNESAHVAELRIEYLPISALKPAERNARKHSEKDIQAIVQSIRDYGFNDPLGIWGGGGHHCRGPRAAFGCSEARHD